MKNTLVASFEKQTPAEHLKERLEQAGIAATINDESMLERYWFLSPPRAAFHVDVDETDYLKVRDFMSGLNETDEALREAVRCPDCGSARTEFPRITRKFLSPMLEALLMKLHLLPREYYCWDCHFTWPEKPVMEPECDALGFPRKPRVMRPKPTLRSAGAPAKKHN